MERSLLILAAAIVFAPVYALAIVDLDGDGQSDVWEAAYGRSLAPSADSDGDGLSNLKESAAGTDPLRSGSTLRVEQIARTPEGAVRLRWPTVAGKAYQLQVSTDLNRWDDLLAPLTGTGAAAEVTLPLETTYLTGRAMLARWTNVTTGLGTIRTNARNGVAPTTDAPTSLTETPQTNPDQNNYGQWLRGWIVPPATGAYTFWIASDDPGELWLSTDANPNNRQKIAENTQWTDFRQWTKYGTQRSTARNLVAGRAYYFEAFQYEYQGGDHLSVAWTGPTLNPDKEIISGQYLATSGTSLAASSAGRPLFFQVKVIDLDSDNDGVSDYEEALAKLDPRNATTVPRVSDLTTLTNTLRASNMVTVGAAQARAYEADGEPARFTFFRSGNLDPLTVRYTVAGSATPGADYTPLSGVVTIGVGENSASIDLPARADAVIEPAESVEIALQSSASYAIGSPASATATIDDAADVLYVAQMRPPNGLRSGGFGTASLRMAGNKVFANFGLSFGNLTSTAAQVHLFVSTNGSHGPSVLGLPASQTPSRRWDFEPASGYTTAQIIAALEAGQLYARITSSAFSSGEIFGRFTREAGWQQMPTPPTPPTLPGGTPSDGDAARFLTQATYGPTMDEITRVKTLGYAGWLDDQFNKPITKHLPYVQARRAEFRARYPQDGENAGWHRPRNEAWWQHSLTGADQLRQRVAFALSEICVISHNSELDDDHDGVTNYYDILLQHSFGNYRDLLQDVTLSPMMGVYLSMIRNRKPDPATGSEPDENYAREIMQLFSIGLSEMHTDGTLKLNAHGMPTPTYTQADIVGLAHVFTGWGPHYDTASPPRWSDGNVARPNDWFYWGWDGMRPMSAYQDFHDKKEKRIVGGTVIPANQTAEEDLKQALDAIFNHPNLGPFVAKQLIQRFVTSNPSPGYVHRVASVFNNNGSGVRGDLRATVRALLLDYEARSVDMLTDRGFGKQREPIIRLANAFRGVSLAAPSAASGDHRLFIEYEYGLPQQVPLGGPSVFNFFQPGFIQQGAIAAAGLLAPEFQITSETTTINQANNNHSAIFWGIWSGEKSGNTDLVTRFNFSALESLVRTNNGANDPQTALVDRLSLLFLNGRMSTALRQQITDIYATLPTWYDYRVNANENWRVERVKIALYLLLASPEFAIQK